MVRIIPNHRGYGLRNDEKPFAHKIPPGGNWRDLPFEDQFVFWNGKVPKNGGNANGLRRRDWDEPASTITANPLQKLSCQLHPSDGYDDNDLEGREYMPYNVTPTLPRNGFTVAELFAGGGLMAIGLKESGFEIVWANDFDKRACRAYAHNIGDHIVCADITKIDPDDIPDVDVIAGGPPCQDYSTAGKGEGDKGERGKLVWTYLNIIERKQPKAFLFENVKGLISKRHRHTFDSLLEKFDEIGYNVSWKLINSWDYGVAQKRERVFIVGIRKDLGFFFEFPEPAPEDYRTQVLRDVIGDLPDPTKQVNGGHLGISENILKHNERNKAKGNGFALVPQKWDKPCGTITASQGSTGNIYPVEPKNHVDYPLTDGAYEHAKKKNIGYNTSLDEPAKTVRASSEQVLDLTVPNHDPKPLSEKALEYLHRDPQRLKKHRPPTIDEPSTTITANLAKGVPYGVFIPNHDKYDGRSYSAVYKIANIKMEWNEPSNTITATGPKYIHPDDKTEPPFEIQNHDEKSFWMPKSEYTYDQANRVQSMDKASATIPAHHNSGQPIHPTQTPRRFTVRECLRIQSVPDWYVIPEDISLSAAYRIVGNGVPSRVAWYLGRALAEQLKEHLQK